jgi:hypothetical protein
MENRPFKQHMYYHIYNSGADRRKIFSSKEDFDRFEAYLYLLNAVESQRAANFFVKDRQDEIFNSARGENLIAIGAYSLTPHQFHILARPLIENGIGKFMQKLQTAYTMFFNKKYFHDGRLFHSAYRSEEINSDERLRRAFTFIHLSPASIFDERWEDAGGSELALLITRALQYRYSSAGEYASAKFVITAPAEFPQHMRRMKDAQTHFASWVKYKKCGEEHSAQ